MKMSALKMILFIGIFLISQRIYSQATFFVLNGNYKYFMGTTEPDTNWYNPDFKDSSWTQGLRSIGYGVKDDSTIIDTVTSVYLRIKFTVANKTTIKCANFFADFDDGFVAYLNGKEIARVNLGKSGERIFHDRLTDRSHEPILYRNYFEPNGLYLDSITLAQNLVNGDNVMAIQVHNDSIKGSDLFFNSLLIDLTNVKFRFWDALSIGAYNIRYNYYYRQVRLDSTKLPIVMLNTDEFGIPASHATYIANMGIINNNSGKYNKPTDPFTDYNGRISIEIRGNNSADMPKKYYRIETQDTVGASFDVSLLGMPKDNDWILYGSFMDKSLIRNELAFTIGKKQGYYEPRTRYCEVFLNGEFQGIYVLMEKIKRGKNRINITKLNPQDNTGFAVTGGYIVNMINVIEYPKPDVITTEQRNYFNGFIDDYFSVLDEPEFSDPVLGYKKYIDENTLLDYIIANELFKNCDSYTGSTYYYKEKDDIDGRLKFGPLWDNDLAFGNAPNSWQQAARTDGWQFVVSNTLGITRILRDTIFANRFKNKWNILRTSGYLSTGSLMNLIDSLANNITDDRVLNFQVWPIINKDLHYNWSMDKVCYSSTYDGAIAKLKSWITQRAQWIDDNINDIYYPTDIKIISARESGSKDRFDISPNPIRNYLNIEYNIAKPGTYSIQICDLSGRIIKNIQKLYFSSCTGSYILENNGLTGISNGLYIITIYNNHNIVHKQKIVRL
jgi:hypothetical protein